MMLALMLLVMLAVISVGLNKVLFDSNKHLFRTQQTEPKKYLVKKVRRKISLIRYIMKHLKYNNNRKKNIQVPQMQHNTPKTFFKDSLSLCPFVLLSFCPFVLESFLLFVLFVHLVIFFKNYFLNKFFF